MVIDNYDSFTYNLCQVSSALTLAAIQYAESYLPAEPHQGLLQYLGDLGCEPVVFKNDEKTIQQIRELQPAAVLVSPGPGMAAPP